MKILRFFLLFGLGTGFQVATAGEIAMLIEGGRAELDIKTNYLPTGSTDNTQTSTAIGYFIGYKFDTNFIIGANTNIYYGNNFLGAEDRSHVYDIAPQLGYAIEFSDRFRLIPIIGYSVWEMDSKEGGLFNSGPEDKREFSGSDLMGKLNFEFPLNDLVSLNASYTYGEYEFGQLKAARFGVWFAF